MTTTVSNGQTLDVSSGNGIVVMYGGTVDVLPGGAVSNTVDSGGLVYVYGEAVGADGHLL